MLPYSPSDPPPKKEKPAPPAPLLPFLPPPIFFLPLLVPNALAGAVASGAMEGCAAHEGPTTQPLLALACATGGCSSCPPQRTGAAGRAGGDVAHCTR